MKAKVISASSGMSLGIERLVFLRGSLAVVLQASGDGGFGDWAGLRLTQGDVVQEIPAKAWIAVGDKAGRGRGSAAAKARRGKAAPEAASETPARRRYLAVLPPEAADRFDPSEPVEVSLEGGRRGRAIALQAEALSPADLVDGLGGALAQVLEAGGAADIAAILRAKISIEPLDIPNRFWIEHLVLSGAALVAKGWMDNLANRTIHVVSADLQTWLPDSAIRRVARPDVHEHLRAENALTSASNEHGYTFVMPQPAGGNQDLYFVEVSPDGRSAVFHGPLAMEPKRDDALALGIVREAFGDIRSLEPEEVDGTYRLLFCAPMGAMAVQVFDFGPELPQDRPVSSIIIPFYGDAFFLNCVHYLQRVLGEGFELVLVVDDERIWPEIYNNIAHRSTGLRVPVRLLHNMANYGYGGANNIAASLSRGDVLFLMNSDILVKDARGLAKAAEAIRARKRAGKPELVAGFSLLYEDGTIQHIGMEFKRSSQVGNLFLADHPMKGLPFDMAAGEPVRAVPAVTAALMGLSKDLFEELGGFDLRYVRGDFEDADLCLRAKHLGAEVLVLMQPGLYHLERQSIPAMGDTDVRAMVTYMNCAEFNRRWAAELSRPKRIFWVSGSKPQPSSAAQA